MTLFIENKCPPIPEIHPVQELLRTSSEESLMGAEHYTLIESPNFYYKIGTAYGLLLQILVTSGRAACLPVE